MANRNGPCRAIEWSTGGNREARHGGRRDRRRVPLHTPHHSGPPPPPLKAEWQGGSGIRLSTVDQGELIPTVQELRVRFRTPPPPPPPLKAEWQGGSGMKPQPSIWAGGLWPSRSTRYLL
jgi:hypothetical protein